MNTILVFFSNELILIGLLLIIFVIYLIEKIFYKKEFNNKFLYLIFVLLLLVLYNILFIELKIPSVIFLLDNYFIYSDFIKYIKAFIIFLSLIFISYLYNFSRLVKIPIFEYIVLILIIILGLFLMISTNHLFYIFLFFD